MAAMHTKSQAPVGSAHWVLDEREHADDAVAQEVEEFAYSVRNDMEWLNEHMAEIFGQKQFDVAEIFKTPGKLRGKTPKTVRKENHENRAPLMDIFASNSRPFPSPGPEKTSISRKSPIHVAEDKENQEHIRSPQHQFPLMSGTQDSGYYDMSQPEAENINKISGPWKDISPKAFPPVAPPESSNIMAVATSCPPRKDRSETIESFVSAKEDQSSKMASKENLNEATSHKRSSEDIGGRPPTPKRVSLHDQATRQSHQYGISATTAAGLDDALEQVERESPARAAEKPADDESLSQGSSLHRPLIRKKSSFASLPAREPLTSTKSLGGSVSQINARDSTRGFSTLRDSVLGKVPSKSLMNEQQSPGQEEDENVDTMDIDDDETANLGKPNSQTSKIHSKTSTQKLHEKFSMLSKTSQPRPSKSIPSIATKGQATSHATTHPFPPREIQPESQNGDDIDDDWIGPIKNQAMHENNLEDHAPAQPSNLAEDDYIVKEPKASERIGTAVPTSQPSIREPQLSTAPAYPILKPVEPESTTPVGSPAAHWKNDGPLSASKARFNSFLKSARGMFASSAAASAQAKMETLSPAASRLKSSSKAALQDLFDPKPPVEAVAEAGTRLFPQPQPENGHFRPPRVPEETQLSEDSDMDASSPDEERAENANLAKDQATDDDNDKLPEIKKIAVNGENRAFQEVSGIQWSDKAEDPVTRPHSKKLSSVPQTKLGEARRPAKHNKIEATKARPAAMSIKVGSQKIGQPATSGTNVQSSNHGPMPSSSTVAKPGQVEKKASNSSLRSASTQASKGPAAASSTRLKALEAADRKREKDEKEAQRKAEQKRKIEEERRQAQAQKQAEQQQQKAAEHQRLLEAKNNTQKQAAEQRKADLLRKNEQMRNKTQLNHYPGQDRFNRNQDGPLNQSQSRPEGGLVRPVSRAQNTIQEHGKPPQPHINPAKPPLKRQFQPEPEEQGPRLPQAPQQGHFSTHNAKRRRTSEEAAEQGPSRPAMAPPIRLSRKDLPSKFSQNFISSTSQQGPSMLKTAVNAAHQAQHPKTPHINDIAKYSKAPIPFAEASNAPQNQTHQYQHKPPPNLKTPATASKSSPHYPNGDNISLPEIATDSEDSDDDNDFVPPEWANSPELRQLLQQQQLVDPMKVFGPIAPLAMEEVFKGSKERQAKFRARTSSANWTGADRLTEEERRRDIEARERLEKDGGWSFNAGV